MATHSMIMEEEEEVVAASAVPGLTQTKVLKIIVIGDASVGKTCLTYRFCKRKFLDATDATIGVDFYERTIRIREDDVRLQLWDTAGQERFRKSMVQHYYRNVHAVIIVYDITKIQTFNSVKGWVDEIQSHGLSGDVPRVLVGTQCDKNNYRVVSTSTAQRLADLHGMPLFETSAYLDSEMNTVDAIFMTIAHKLYNQRPFRVVSTEEDSPREKKPTRLITLNRSKRKKCC